MTCQFQADADLNQIIVAARLRRAPELDFRAASVAGLERPNDLEVLVLAFVTSQESPGPRAIASPDDDPSSPVGRCHRLGSQQVRPTSTPDVGF
jgi:hypothetical protein